MATKRSAAYVHPSRRDHVPNEPRPKRQKPDNAGAKSFKKAHPVNELKSQIRSLKRLLERNDRLPADVRVEKERALQTARSELEQAEKAQQRNEMIGRYHKIRFFDKQKAIKRLTRAQKELDGCEEGSDRRVELARKVEDAQINVNYATNFPLNRHYIPLFPRKRTKNEDEGEGDVDTNGDEGAAELRGDSEMRERVKQCMADGTLDALRNGKLMKADEFVSAKKKRHKGRDDASNRAVDEVNETAAGVQENEKQTADEESDGFFE